MHVTGMKTMRGKLEEKKKYLFEYNGAEVMIQVVWGLMTWDGVCWVGRLPLAGCSEASQDECCHCTSPFVVRLVKKLVSCSKGLDFHVWYSYTSCWIQVSQLALLDQRGMDKATLEVPSNLNHFVILWTMDFARSERRSCDKNSAAYESAEELQPYL